MVNLFVGFKSLKIPGVMQLKISKQVGCDTYLAGLHVAN